MSIVRYAAVLQAQPEGGFTVKGGVWIESAAAIQAAMAVRAARQEQGRTLAELARSLGTSWAAAQKLESPRANPTIKQLERTAAALGKRLVLSIE